MPSAASGAITSSPHPHAGPRHGPARAERPETPFELLLQTTNTDAEGPPPANDDRPPSVHSDQPMPAGRHGGTAAAKPKDSCRREDAPDCDDPDALAADEEVTAPAEDQESESDVVVLANPDIVPLPAPVDPAAAPIDPLAPTATPAAVVVAPPAIPVPDIATADSDSQATNAESLSQQPIAPVARAVPADPAVPAVSAMPATPAQPASHETNGSAPEAPSHAAAKPAIPAVPATPATPAAPAMKDAATETATTSPEVAPHPTPGGPDEHASQVAVDHAQDAPAPSPDRRPLRTVETGRPIIQPTEHAAPRGGAAAETAIKPDAATTPSATTSGAKEPDGEAKAEGTHGHAARESAESFRAQGGPAELGPATQAAPSPPTANSDTSPSLVVPTTHSGAAPAPANAAPVHAPYAMASSAPVPIAGLAVEIFAHARAGQNRFEIRLDPPELGRIDVHLHVDRDGNVHSRLFVERVETLDLLRRDAPALERALQNAGLKTGEQGLEFSLRHQAFGRGDDDRGSAGASRVIVTDEIVPLADATSFYGRRLGIGAGVDIRV